ncbi:hypothetical protein [Anabaena sp. UHCC 0187]|jgi:hypothetical protein|nr:hypothetical protein [Anabaena sp. UHCC 0187]
MMAKIAAGIFVKAENYIFWSMPNFRQAHKNYLEIFMNGQPRTLI